MPEDGDGSGVIGDRSCTFPGETDCDDNCPAEANDQTDSDGDGTGDVCDLCPTDPDKTAPRDCGCGVAESVCFVSWFEDFESYTTGQVPAGWTEDVFAIGPPGWRTLDLVTLAELRRFAIPG